MKTRAVSATEESAPASYAAAKDGGEDEPSQPAHIEITIPAGGFVDVLNVGGVGDDRLTTATWTLKQPAPPGISQAAPNGTLVVKRPMKIDFDLNDTKYRLAGIAFRRVRGNGPGNGHGNMPKGAITVEERFNGTSTVHVQNTWDNHGQPNTFTWDFFIFVQDESGDVGIIDPDIENRDSGS